MINKNEAVDWLRLIMRTFYAFLMVGLLDFMVYSAVGIEGFWMLLAYAVSNFVFVLWVVHYAKS